MEVQWPLILFTFFLCLCGGILAFQGLLTLLGRGKQTQLVSLIVSLVSLVIGGIAVFTHLQHWERIFNGFSALIVGKGEYGMSGIGLELWGCVIFALTVIIYFLFMRRSEDGVAPKWCAVLAIIVGIALPVVTGDSYLMAAVPAWNTPMLIVYYLFNTLVLGSLTMMVICEVCKCSDGAELLGKICLGAIALQLILVIAYAAYIGSLGNDWTEIIFYFDPTLPDTAMVDESAATSILTGTYALEFWLGVVVIGCALPAILVVLGKKLAGAEGALGKRLCIVSCSLLCAMAGSLIWRVVLYQVAISSFALY